MAKKKEVIIEVEVEAEGWQVSFADLLSLLVTFFVLMLSMTAMDNKKFAGNSSMSSTAPISVLEGGGSLVQPVRVVPNVRVEELMRIYSPDVAAQELTRAIERVPDGVTMTRTSEEIVVHFEGEGFFDSQSGEISEKGITALHAVRPTVQRLTWPMAVEESEFARSVAIVEELTVDLQGAEQLQLAASAPGALQLASGNADASNGINLVIDLTTHTLEQ